MFIGYSAQHKGVKFLDIPTGRVYISRDVVFDETQFPFSKLHPNAGALLHKEIILLPPNLTGFDQGGNNFDDQLLANSHNRVHELCDDAAENCEENSEEIIPNASHFMCPALGDKSSLGSVEQEPSSRSTWGSVE